MSVRKDEYYIGLNAWASDFISEPTIEYTDHIRRVYADKTVEDIETKGIKCLVQQEPSGRIILGIFDIEYPLHKYTFPDGKTIYEFLQAEPWSSSSGLIMFTALEDKEGERLRESLWTDKEIKEYL